MKAILLFIFSIIGILAFSQAPTFDWAKRWSSTGAVEYDMALDDNGNSYVLSTGGTQDNFNPESNTPIYASSSGSGAISKFNQNGNLIWVKFIVHSGGFTSGGCIPKRIFIRGNNIYYTGEFNTNSSFDFDFGSSQSLLSGSGCFVSKIDLNGNFQWESSIMLKLAEIARFSKY